MRNKSPSSGISSIYVKSLKFAPELILQMCNCVHIWTTINTALDLLTLRRRPFDRRLHDVGGTDHSPDDECSAGDQCSKRSNPFVIHCRVSAFALGATGCDHLIMIFDMDVARISH